LTYHMGWSGEGAGKESQGKRIRPLLVLLTCWASGGNWQTALPAAAAVELVHNFSLVHDDIQDKSDLRRGRLTVWRHWGVPQGINAGDGLFVLSNLALMDLQPEFSPEIVVKAVKILQITCLNLTRGQFMDINNETRNDLTVNDYWSMISGKTAALLAASCSLGALLGGANEPNQEAYTNFGHYLGMAFQVQDDILGVWGDSDLTGKSNDSDLITGKKTLPILIGVQKCKKFAKRWQEGPISPGEAPRLANLLKEEGIQLESQLYVDQMTDLALQSLRLAVPNGEAEDYLFTLASQLVNRNS
jgi:geranylgeranyl diphosphate synthase type I